MSEMRPEVEIEYLKDQIQKICKEFYGLFEDKPNEDGYYFHLGVCSGDRRKPIGNCGCACKSSPIFKRLRNPHDWILTEETRLPERGFNTNSFECSKCKWTSVIWNIELTVDELNKNGWCPVFDEKTP